MDFAISVDQKVKIKESEKIDKYMDLARELKKRWNNGSLCACDSLQSLGKETWGIGNQKKNQDNPEHSNWIEYPKES